MPYYALFEEDNGENIGMKCRSQPPIDYRSGRPLSPGIVEPIAFSMIAGEDNFYGQFDPDFAGEYVPKPPEQRLKASYNDGSLLSYELAMALQQAGVDNLELFAADVRDADTGDAVTARYVFANVVGLVDCAIREESLNSPSDGQRFFDRLVIDEDKAPGLSMFRLLESPSTVVVNEQVATVVNSPEFNGVRADLLPVVRGDAKPHG